LFLIAYSKANLIILLEFSSDITFKEIPEGDLIFPRLETIFIISEPSFSLLLNSIPAYRSSVFSLTTMISILE